MDPFKPGQILTAAQLNELASLMVRKIDGGRGINARVFGSKILIENTALERDRDAPPRWLVVDSVKRDVYLCRYWDFNSGAALVGSPTLVVAKPVDHRGSLWHGKTIGGVAYVSTDGTTEESGHTTRTADGVAEALSPAFVTGSSLILAARALKTGVTYQTNPVNWYDTNQAGRYWLSASAAGLVYAKWTMDLDTTLTEGGETTIPWSTGVEEENTGSGFELSGDGVKVLAPAAGKLLHIQSNIRFEYVSNAYAMPRVECFGYLNATTEPFMGQGNPAPNVTANHTVVGLSSEFHTNYNFGTYRRFALNDVIYIRVGVWRDDNNNGRAKGDEATFVALKVVD